MMLRLIIKVDCIQYKLYSKQNPVDLVLTGFIF